jgi:Kef-type K+ transport system membrane component KefB
MRWKVDAVELDVLTALLIDLAVIVVVAKVGGALARQLGQPAVTGEIAAGILLGPTLFGGGLARTLFPAEVRPSLATLATVAVSVFMFFVGRHFDPTLLRGQSRIASTVSLAAVAVPFCLGASLAGYLLGGHPTGDRVAFVLFVGTAMSITAFPVLARILADRGLIDTPIGGLALACAAIGDVLAWSLLAVVVALAGGGSDPWRVLVVVPFVALMAKVARPLLARLGGHATRSRPAGAAVLAWVAIGLPLSAAATEWMGLHAIFGAFLAGAVIPRQSAAWCERALEWVERTSVAVLLPVFFVAAGLNVDLSSMDGTAIGELALILLVAVGGKFAGVFLGARSNGMRGRHCAVLAILINTRGLTELIVLTVGLRLGVLDRELYGLMVVMALVTTAMTGILLRLVYPEERVRLDRASPDYRSEVHPLPAGQVPGDGTADGTGP